METTRSCLLFLCLCTQLYKANTGPNPDQETPSPQNGREERKASYQSQYLNVNPFHGNPKLVAPVGVSTANWIPSPGFPRYVPKPPPAPRPSYQPVTTTTPANPPSEATTSSPGNINDPLQPRDYFPPPNMIRLLEDEEATTLLSLFEQVDQLGLLREKKPFTLFAPTNEAFARLDRRTVEALTDDRELLESVLRYHIVPDGKIFTKILKDDLQAESLRENSTLRFNVNQCDNLFSVNGAELDQDRMDQRAANGVVHFIHDVLYPIPEDSLYQTLTDDSRFIRLVRAIDVADMVEFLDLDEGPFTIFAPTNEAFELIPEEALKELLADKQGLSVLLSKHIVRGTKLSQALTSVNLKTLAESGDEIKVTLRKGNVFINNEATVIDGDILSTNGAIQVVNRVLL